MKTLEMPEILEKKYLQKFLPCCIIFNVVTLIALKREVATIPW
jgi:hypothetical protein